MMVVRLKNVRGEQVSIKASEEFSLVLLADERELISVTEKGEVLVNGDPANAELVGLALIQWANKAGRVLADMQYPGEPLPQIANQKSIEIPKQYARVATYSEQLKNHLEDMEGSSCGDS